MGFRHVCETARICTIVKTYGKLGWSNREGRTSPRTYKKTNMHFQLQYNLFAETVIYLLLASAFFCLFFEIGFELN
jgi:hypothetical protein